MLAAGLCCTAALSVADDGRRSIVDRGALSGEGGAAVNTTLDQNGP